ncbi:MAG: sulfurtransferase [Alphaproteobacteria bacterium]|jgi:rhodanese-related sulfurtransferase|nr:sulfurtransferase [Alphaproteobacteria bacterium]
MQFDQTVDSILPMQLKEIIEKGIPLTILDVREVDEVNICALSNSVHIPLRNLREQWETLPQDQLIVTLCHHGYRSLQAALFLKTQGFDAVLNLSGGIEGWGDLVDPEMTRY